MTGGINDTTSSMLSTTVLRHPRYLYSSHYFARVLHRRDSGLFGGGSDRSSSEAMHNPHWGVCRAAGQFMEGAEAGAAKHPRGKSFAGLAGPDSKLTPGLHASMQVLGMKEVGFYPSGHEH